MWELLSDVRRTNLDDIEITIPKRIYWCSQLTVRELNISPVDILHIGECADIVIVAIILPRINYFVFYVSCLLLGSIIRIITLSHPLPTKLIIFKTSRLNVQSAYRWCSCKPVIQWQLVARKLHSLWLKYLQTCHIACRGKKLNLYSKKYSVNTVLTPGGSLNVAAAKS